MILKEIAFWIFIFVGTYLLYKKLRPTKEERYQGTALSAEGEEASALDEEIPLDKNLPSDEESSATGIDEDKETIRCPNCGKENEVGYRFCDNCVHDLRG